MMPRPRSHHGAARAVAVILLTAVMGASGACAKSLEALAPFPCTADMTCPDGFTCELTSNGGTACAPTISCPSGQMPCNGACFDPTADDPRNCGGCGVDCGAGGLCCSGKCAQPDSDAQNCGGCGKACTDDKSCIQGACACTPEETVCSGVCADLSSDSLHCGSCSNSCGDNACAGGVCQPCPPEMTQCNNTCVYTELDPSNCGGCGNACSSSQVCTNGSCGCGACGSVSCGVCNDPGWVFNCDAGTIVCCAPDHPFYCPGMAPGGCWNIPIDCSKAVMCSDGSWHGCLPGETFDCASMMCN
jgi:hypothetical protein